MRKVELFIVAILIGLATMARGNGVGTTGASFLKVGVGARSLAMAGATASTIGDANAIYWNPAGLASIKQRSFTASYNLLFVDQSQGFVGYARNLGEGKGTLGVGVNYMQVGKIERRGLVETEGHQGTFSNANYAASLSYARADVFTEGLSVGANLTAIRTDLDTFKKNTFAVDLGLTKRFGERATFALVAKNIGRDLGPDPLPLLIRPSAAYRLLNNKLTLAADAEIWLRDKRNYLDLGAEYWVNSALAMRAGYQLNRAQDKQGGLAGLGAGMGITHNNVSIDYAFVPFGDLGNTHRLTLGTRF